jgi:hypothetical protein
MPTTLPPAMITLNGRVSSAMIVKGSNGFYTQAAQEEIVSESTKAEIKEDLSAH